MSKNLIFVVDSNIPYLDSVVSDYTKKWGYDVSSRIDTSVWSDSLVNQNNLFGTKNIVHLNLRDSKDLKVFSEDIKKNPQEFTGDWFGNGLIITAKDARSIKKIEDVISNCNGIVVKKRKPKEVVADLLKDLSVSNNIKTELTNFAGDEYDLILGVVKYLKNLPVEEQKNISLEQVLLRIPFPPGQVPPWEFVNPLFEGNLKSAIDKLERSMTKTHALLPLSMLSKEIDKLYKYVILNTLKVKDTDKLKPMGLNNQYGLISVKKIKTKLSIETVEYLVNLVHLADSDYKNGRVYNSNVYMRSLLTKISYAIRANKPLERL